MLGGFDDFGQIIAGTMRPTDAYMSLPSTMSSATYDADSMSRFLEWVMAHTPKTSTCCVATGGEGMKEFENFRNALK